METKQLIIWNGLIFILSVIIPVESSMFSILAYAALANLLKPRPKYLPPPPPPPPAPAPIYYDSLNQPAASPFVGQSPVHSLASQFVPQPSKRGFGFPGAISLDSNPVTDWAKSLKSHPESQKVPSFYGSYPANGYQIFNGPPPRTNLLMPKKSGVQPVFRLAGVADHFKSVPDKGIFQF